MYRIIRNYKKIIYISLALMLSIYTLYYYTTNFWYLSFSEDSVYYAYLAKVIAYGLKGLHG